MRKVEGRYLTAHAKGFEWIETKPATVPSLAETIHELFIECPLEGGETHQDHVFLFTGQLSAQHVMTPPSKHRQKTTDVLPLQSPEIMQHYTFISCIFWAEKKIITVQCFLTGPKM